MTTCFVGGSVKSNKGAAEVKSVALQQCDGSGVFFGDAVGEKKDDAGTAHDSFRCPKHLRHQTSSAISRKQAIGNVADVMPVRNGLLQQVCRLQGTDEELKKAVCSITGIVHLTVIRQIFPIKRITERRNPFFIRKRQKSIGLKRFVEKSVPKRQQFLLEQRLNRWDIVRIDLKKCDRAYAVEQQKRYEVAMLQTIGDVCNNDW